ncbi:hypothetical protein JK358_28030 [Nocardia sp. 2]|uniref:Uncharacterized protein n=1 Tax=Nocardia acididurans TaxID=2802282 RepID=A0ABS1MGC2_9NOCA|nr:hypothetical protein [Nocardia acididurans]MBL1078263.1 hypothetical protein [Nocardia acididurans]
MDLTASGDGVTAPVARSNIVVQPWVPASILFAANIIWAVGATWDIQWHADVGPDTFFTVPHLFIYASAAIAGFTALAVILGTTAAGRAGRAVDPELGGPGIGVFGRAFTAPLGYLVASLGAAAFLLYGLWDLWWHTIYGFDAVIDSPPHIGLFLSSTLTSVGSVIVFASARAHHWGALGTPLSLGLLLVSSTVTALAVSQLNAGTVRWTTVVTAFMALMLLVTGAAFRAFGATLVAMTASVVQGVFWWFAPWAAHVYADAVGLPVRDNLRGIPVTPALVPLVLIPLGLALDLLLRRARPTARVLPTLAGGFGGAVIALCAPFQTDLIYGSRPLVVEVIVNTALFATLFGCAGGILGWGFGRMLRLAAPESAAAQEVRA